MPQAEPDIELTIIERCAWERTRIAVRRYQGHRFVDLRRQRLNRSGVWRNTRDGITFRGGELGEVAAAINAARELLA